ncbi:type II and III secretion system protein family protein [Dyella caseinilytica]|uniref:Pilus assembly protein N-terminal domain-containing protein n=1 Tax=Dyella caseinilytica TaxID=1849581 RepID=A0ABX7GY88_9GAMM|nr:pilus assembly protein N-terminal domain-containing protein [Dyella caseinilytica]QRN55465.1 pilus assembly protein N-terminal domain-containing protein [Dyella caseinilytica]GGA01916.1 membrane protein [Dyella caseinilytica]
MMRYGYLYCLGALALITVPCIASDATADVVLQTHEQRPWRLPADLERIAIADPGVADVVTLKSRGEVLLVGKQAGETVLLLWHHGQSQPQRLTVVVRSAIQSQLENDAGTQVDQQDGTALLRGEAPSLLDHQQALNAATSGDAKAAVADMSTIDSGEVVQVDVKVVEFDKTAMSEIGLNLIKSNGGFTFGTFAPTTLSSVQVGSTQNSSSTNSSSTVGGVTFTATQPISSAFNLIFNKNNLFGDLSLLQSDGLARVLAEPTLVALSGQSASFLAGGELPIPEPQGLGTVAIVYKPYGVGLTLTPTVLAPDRIALKVAPEASELDYTNELVISGVSVPAITTRRADTTVELGDGETFVIGGLVSQDITSQMNKIPLLGDIPIIGAFFRDMQYSKQDKELVIMVTPHLVHAVARGVKLPLPGEREQQQAMPVWGSFLLNPAGSDQLPGFSR